MTAKPVPNLRERTFWRTLYERDLDLVFLDLLHSSEPFRARLLSHLDLEVALKSETCEFAGAWHSVVDEMGRESDLEAEWRLDGPRRIRLLIEDKIDARCQPGQAEGYADRAAAYRRLDPQLMTRTLLVAPFTYPQVYRDDTAPFEAHLAIEKIVEWLDGGLVGERGRYLKAMLKHALLRWGALREQGESGKPTYPTAYVIVREELAAFAPDLAISNPKDSAWMYFEFAGRRPGSNLRYRLADHWAELVFERHRIAEEALRRALARHPLPDASVADRGHSELTVWCPTPEVDHSADALAQREPIRRALQVIDSLRRWYLDAVEAFYL